MAESVQAKLSRSRNGCVVKCYRAVQSCFVCASASTVICCGVLLWRPNLFSPVTDISSNHILQLCAKHQQSALCKQYAEHSSSHLVLFSVVITWPGYWLRFRGIVVRFLAGASKRSERLWPLPSRYRGAFCWREAALAWSWSLTYAHCQVSEWVELYLLYPICFMKSTGNVL